MYTLKRCCRREDNVGCLLLDDILVSLYPIELYLAFGMWDSLKISSRENKKNNKKIETITKLHRFSSLQCWAMLLLLKSVFMWYGN